VLATQTWLPSEAMASGWRNPSRDPMMTRTGGGGAAGLRYKEATGVLEP
jgi:hypothetical protein